MNDLDKKKLSRILGAVGAMCLIVGVHLLLLDSLLGSIGGGAFLALSYGLAWRHL